MKRAADLLGAVLRRMKKPEAETAWLRARWAALVGDVFATHIRPAHYAKGILYIQADSREWKMQAETMSEKMRDRMNREWGKSLVQQICIEMPHQSASVRREIDNSHLPFLANRRTPRS